MDASGSGPIGEHVLVDGVRVFHRRTASFAAGDTPTVFVHGNPTNSAQWMPFLREVSGPAIAPDLPGWGRSERPPPREWPGGMHELAAIVERHLEVLGIEEHNLVVQDWGALALIAAQRAPERVRRLVIMNSVPLLPGYRWHWVARWFWRRRGLGELLNTTITRPGLRIALRDARAGRRPIPSPFLDLIADHWDAGTSRAILRLYRSADPAALAAAGNDLGELRCPALILWGAADPYLPFGFARRYAEKLGGEVEVGVLGDAGHWPWLDRPDVIRRVTAFLAH